MIPAINPAITAAINQLTAPAAPGPYYAAAAMPALPGGAAVGHTAAGVGVFDFDGLVPRPESDIKIYDVSALPLPVLIYSLERGVSSEHAPLPLRGRINLCSDALSSADRFSRSVLKKHPVDSPTKDIAAHFNAPGVMNNAFWDGDQIMFGDYTPAFMHRMDLNLDIIRHELGHSVVESAGGLDYIHQSGALNESIADVYAIVVKHYTSGCKANSPDANWEIGEGLMANNEPLRRMDRPGHAHNFTAHFPFGDLLIQDSQVGHMEQYVRLPKANDLGGVHTYSGIPSKAFQIAAASDQGQVHKRIAKIWFKALELSPTNSTFSRFATCTLESAEALFPKNGDLSNIVGQAWEQVGVEPMRMLRHT